MSLHITDVDQDQFATLVLDESHQRPVVVDFWAEWCGPCRTLGPALERLAAEGSGTWLLAKVDVDQNPALAQQFGVQGIPTVVAFRDGQVINRFTGALPEPQLREFVGSIVPSQADMTAAAAELALDRGDTAGAEAGFRSVLADDPAHEVAGVGLASLLLDAGDAAGALEVLSRLARSETVRRMEAAARLLAEPSDLTALAEAAANGSEEAQLAYARGLAAHGDVDEALRLLVELVGSRGDLAEDARLVALDLFELLGQDHALVVDYRRKLASALF